MVACMPAARLFVVRYVSRLFRKRSHATEIVQDHEMSTGNEPSSPGSQIKDKVEQLRSSMTSNGSTKAPRRKLTKSAPAPAPAPGFSPKDLDKNRRYFSQVVVSSNGHHGGGESSLPPVEDSNAEEEKKKKEDEEELGSNTTTAPREEPPANDRNSKSLNLAESPPLGTLSLPRPGEYLGVPESMLTPPSEQPAAPTRAQKRWSDGFKKIWVRQDVSVTRSSATMMESEDAKSGGWL